MMNKKELPKLEVADLIFTIDNVVGYVKEIQDYLSENNLERTKYYIFWMDSGTTSKYSHYVLENYYSDGSFNYLKVTKDE